MNVYITTLRRMKLHHAILWFPKPPLDFAHFFPCRTTSRSRNTDVFPTLAPRDNKSKMAALTSEAILSFFDHHGAWRKFFSYHSSLRFTIFPTPSAGTGLELFRTFSGVASHTNRDTHSVPRHALQPTLHCGQRGQEACGMA